MKIAFLSALGILAAYGSGVCIAAFAARSDSLFGVAFVLAMLVSIFCHASALHCLRAELARTMFHDLLAIEALLDDKEFDHG